MTWGLRVGALLTRLGHVRQVGSVFDVGVRVQLSQLQPQQLTPDCGQRVSDAVEKLFAEGGGARDLMSAGAFMGKGPILWGSGSQMCRSSKPKENMTAAGDARPSHAPSACSGGDHRQIAASQAMLGSSLHVSDGGSAERVTVTRSGSRRKRRERDCM